MADVGGWHATIDHKCIQDIGIHQGCETRAENLFLEGLRECSPKVWHRAGRSRGEDDREVIWSPAEVEQPFWRIDIPPKHIIHVGNKHGLETIVGESSEN